MCWVCGASFPSVNAIFSHFSFDHNVNLNGCLICDEDGCKRSFSIWTLLRKHFLNSYRFPKRSSSLPSSLVGANIVPGDDRSDSADDLNCAEDFQTILLLLTGPLLLTDLLLPKGLKCEMLLLSRQLLLSLSCTLIAKVPRAKYRRRHR